MRGHCCTHAGSLSHSFHPSLMQYAVTTSDLSVTQHNNVLSPCCRANFTWTREKTHKQYKCKVCDHCTLWSLMEREILLYSEWSLVIPYCGNKIEWCNFSLIFHVKILQPAVPNIIHNWISILCMSMPVHWIPSLFLSCSRPMPLSIMVFFYIIVWPVQRPACVYNI